MKGSYAGLDSAIKNHLKMIRDTGGLPQDDETLEALAIGWREKEEAFDDQVRSMGMSPAKDSADASRGFLALTYSGSLVAVGPDDGGARKSVYVSIDRRRDVPARAEDEDSRLEGPVVEGREIHFIKGPVKKSSAIYKLAVLPAALALEDQNDRLEEATIALTKEFQAVDETRFDDPR